jgi:hypothetical protein
MSEEQMLPIHALPPVLLGLAVGLISASAVAGLAIALIRGVAVACTLMRKRMPAPLARLHRALTPARRHFHYRARRDPDWRAFRAKD